MDKEFDLKIKKMVKSMYKTVQNMNEKNAVSDVLDSNNVAQMSPDSVASDKTGALNKNKEKMKKDLKKDASKTLGIKDDGVYKNEDFVKDVMKSFGKISKAYIEKMGKK